MPPVGVGAEPGSSTEETMDEHQYSPAGMATGQAEKLSAILQERLASLIDLSLILKHVHWNVIGRGFIDPRTDGHSDGANQGHGRRGRRTDHDSGWCRRRSGDPGGGDALGGRRICPGPCPGHGASRALGKVYERIGTGHREAIEQVSCLDPVTEDLLLSQAAQLETNHWLIRAHMSDTDGRSLRDSPANWTPPRRPPMRFSPSSSSPRRSGRSAEVDAV
jgi:starvation-inducible DNA-binding protein